MADSKKKNKFPKDDESVAARFGKYVTPSEDDRAPAEDDDSFAARARKVLGDAPVNSDSGMLEHAGSEPRGFHKHEHDSYESPEDIAASRQKDRATEDTMDSQFAADRDMALKTFANPPGPVGAPREEAGPPASAKMPPTTPRAKKPHTTLADKISLTALPEDRSAAAKIKADDNNTNNDDLDQELRDARQDFKNAKTDLDKREAAETIANALGRIGAGLYGGKTGVDMSGVKFGTQDWDKKRGAAGEEFRTSLADISDRRRQQAQNAQFNKKFDQDADQFTRGLDEKKNEFGQTVGLEKGKLGETTRHDKAMENIYGAKAAEAGQSSLSKLNTKQSAAFKKNVEDVSKDIYQVSQDLAKDGDEDVASQRIQGLLQNKLGVSPEAAKKIVVDEGIFSDGINDPAKIQAAVNSIAATQTAVAQMKANVPDGQVLIQKANGELGYAPAAQVAKERAANQPKFDAQYKVIP